VRADPFDVGLAWLDDHTEPAHLCATAWVLDSKRGRTLLVRHRHLGWSVPGGHLEPGEEPGEGARRELREETGIVGRLLLPEPCFVHTGLAGGERPHRHWNLAYAVEADPDGPLLIERDPAAWFPLDDLPDGGPGDLAEGLATVIRLSSQLSS
jgi:8-oxo-dGTP diphosphatase